MEGEKTMNLKRSIVEKGVQQLLDEAKVPLHVHLGILRQLKRALKDNEKQSKDHESKVEEHTKAIERVHEFYQGELKGLGGTLLGAHETHTAQVAEYKQEIERLKTIQRGEDGLPGLDAPAVDEEALVSKLLSKIPLPEKGDKGDKGDTLALDSIMEAVIKRIQKGDVLHINNVKGAGAFIKDGIRYRFEELMHGGGTTTAANALTVVAITGVRDDTNVTFTATTNPTFLNINGALYPNTGGAITWTFLAETITLSSPVGVGGYISGLK